MSAEHRDSTDFPLAPVGAMTPPIDTHSLARPDARLCDSRLSRVLVISDDDALREQLSRTLGNRYALFAVPDRAAAFEALRLNAPDLLLLDESPTPRANSEFLARLRSNPQFHSLPVMQFSATGDELAQCDDSEPQADDYLFKPIAARLLLARVENQLQLARLKTALEESQARLALAAGVASLGAWEYDLTSKDFCCDAQVVRLLGIPNPASATRPFSWSNFASASDRGRVDAEFRKACETGAPFQVDFCVEHADGTTLWLNCCGQILDVRGRLRMAGILKDATERRLAVEKAATSEARYHELLKNANSAIIRWSCDGTINYINEFGLEFFGYREEEVLGRNVDMFVPECESTGVDLVRLARDVVAHPERYLTSVNENICRDGTRVWMN